jgi:hypothetical protein
MPDLTKEVDVMHLGDASDLIKVPLFSRDLSEAVSPFNGQEERSEWAVMKGLHQIITLSLECFNAWLRPLLSRSRKDAVSSVQDHDPYLESLLRALHGHK